MALMIVTVKGGGWSEVLRDGGSRWRSETECKCALGNVSQSRRGGRFLCPGGGSTTVSVPSACVCVCVCFANESLAGFD